MANTLHASGSTTSITAGTAFLDLTNTATDIVATAASARRVTHLSVSNTTAGALWVTVDIYRSAAQKVIVYQMDIPANSFNIIIGIDAPLYLQDGDALRLQAESGTGSLKATCSYETYS